MPDLKLKKTEELLNKIGQLQYEISILDIDEERLTGVDIRTEELKELIKQGQPLPIDNVSKRFSLADIERIINTVDNLAELKFILDI